MEPDEILQGKSLMELLTNIIKRTPESVNTGEAGGEEFESAEHENIGNKVKLRFPVSNPSSGRRFLRLPNGLELSFGQIIALAGDFYGVPESPIIDPSEEHDKKTTGRRQRFIAAYNTLASAEYDDIKKELDQILKIMTKEKSQIEAALESQGETVPKDVYDKLGNSLVEKWDEVTGGTWVFGLPVIFGRMMKLAEKNHDHFLPFAKEAFLAGHELALEKAREASKVGHQETKIRLLEEAYSIDAFACHFLTDSFSSGHLR